MINLGLKRTARLLQLISQWQYQQSSFEPPWKAIHIAGTNGKGSVAAYLAALLKRAAALQDGRNDAIVVGSDENDRGVRIGRFTSPHFIDHWDCIVINDKTVPEDVFRRAEEEVKIIAKQVEQELYQEGKRDLSASHDGDTAHPLELPDAIAKELTKDAQPTEFEILTATTFKIFSDSSPTPCNIAVIECGLGGRLDATNVLPTSVIAVSIITRIGLDHVDILGGSLRSIVKEKCGILREEVPVVVDGENTEDVLDMIREEVQGRFGEKWMSEMVSFARGADVMRYLDIEEPNNNSSTNTQDQSQYPRLQNLLPHQLTNLALAIKAFELLVHHNPTLTKTLFDGTSQPPPPPTASLLETVLHDASTSYPARLQLLNPGWLTSTPYSPTHTHPTLNRTRLLLDGAHNEQSAIVLRDYTDKATTQPNTQTPTPIPTLHILALSSTKPPAAILQTLLCPAAPTSKIIFTSFRTPPTMPWVQSHPPSDLLATAKELGLEWNVLGVTDDIVGALDVAERELQRYSLGDGGGIDVDGDETGKPLVVVAGSLYLASEFLRSVRDGRGAFGG